MRLDFFARRNNYIDHLAPVWNAFPRERRGIFHVDIKCFDHARRELGWDDVLVFDGNSPSGDDPILSCAYGDMIRAARRERIIITMEHGTGHTFGTAGYPDGRGKRDEVDLFLMPNEYTARKLRAVRDTRCEVIGTPKTDLFVAAHRPISPDPVIGIAFHWGGAHASPPESGNAFEHYKNILPELAKRYRMIGHGHPLSMHEFRPVYQEAGIEVIEDFREVIERADIFINDLSSAMYEFLVTGRPVIVMNAPWFRREVNFGIRFWDYSDIGINVEGPGQLFDAIDLTLKKPSLFLEERVKAIHDLYPYLGTSTRRAVAVLIDYLDELEAGLVSQPA